MEENRNAFQFYIEAVDAAEHLDAVLAYDFYKNFDANTRDLENDPDLKNDLPLLKKELLYVSLPVLPTQDVERLLSSQVLSMIRSGIDLDERLAVRNDYIPYGEGENEQRIFKRALLGNNEKIGERGIKEWLLAFDKIFTPLVRKKESILEFLTSGPKMSTLTKSEQAELRAVLLAYENWIAAYHLNTFDVAYLQKRGKKVEVGTKIISDFPLEARQVPGKVTEAREVSLIQLPLLQALSKYDQLGNQLITNERIRVKSQMEPVRPSLLYWLKYYRDELGIGHHDSVQRGQFLFRSENGRKLSYEERERMNLILKSVEENMPLSIDTVKSEIVFPHFEAPIERPTAQSVPPLAFEPAPKMAPKPVLQREPVEVPRFVAPPEKAFQVGHEKREVMKKEESVPEKGTLSFTSSHVFPAEKEQKVQSRKPQEISPFHIRPL